jgi:hypothetical protein
MSCISRAHCARVFVTGVALLALPAVAAEPSADLAEALATIRAVAPQGQGHSAAALAMKTVSQAAPADLPRILAAMNGANPIATNWLRGAAEAVAQRAAAQDKLPARELEEFLADQRHAPRGRRLAYELLASVDPTAERRLIPTLLDDRSLELRRDAVAQLLAEADKIEPAEQALGRYQKAFHHARDLDQIQAAAAKLKSLDAAPDIASHMGFVLRWKLVGPLDNVADRGWDTDYPPEEKIDLAAQYDGQKGPVRWLDHTTTDDYGHVDLAKALDKHKGAVAYAYAELIAGREQPCELRLGTPNASKVWLNGQQIGATHVYHANETIDQYVASGMLQPGRNTILLKICQNEQTEPWAQGWHFKLRVCDAIGTAILSEDRPGQKVAVAARGREGERGRGGD